MSKITLFAAAREPLQRGDSLLYNEGQLFGKIIKIEPDGAIVHTRYGGKVFVTRNSLTAYWRGERKHKR